MATPARRTGSSKDALEAEQVPRPVRDLLARLEGAGHPSVLVGGCVRDLLESRPVHDFDVAGPASPETVLALFPRAVPTGLRHGTVMVPTPCGPVDVTRFRGDGTLADDLAHRDFTVNALAWRPGETEPIDLHDGRSDLRAGRLRAVGDADARLAEDPARALRAVRLLAERGWQPDDALEQALGRAAPALSGVAAERLRAELIRTLTAPHVREALELLRRSGLEAALAPGVAEGAAAVVDALPRDRDLRLAGWLIGAPAQRVLARLRFAQATSRRVARVLAEHPVEARTDPARPPMVRRLLHRFDAGEIDWLIALSRAEAEVAGRDTRRIDALCEAIATEHGREHPALHRDDLALDGDAVMAALGSGPGPEIGEALRYLTDCVLEDPAMNEPDRLRERLEAWAKTRR